MFGKSNCLRRGVNDPEKNQFDCGLGAVYFAEFLDGYLFLTKFIFGNIQWEKGLVDRMQEYVLDMALGFITLN